MSDAPHIAANIERFMGFAEDYDRYRPAVAPVIPVILTQLALMPRPRCVVDIGSGTGLSTRAWIDLADEVIGVEPSDDMRRQAERVTPDIPYIRYQKGLSTATGLPDGCADIVTVSQALHWMEPVGTFSEIARLLRPGGVFAAIDNDWPPTFNLEAEAAEDAFDQNAERLLAVGAYARDVKKWRKEEHFERMQKSGHFRFTKEIAVYHVEPGSADRIVGIAISQGDIQTLIKNGLSADQIGLTAYHADVRRIIGAGPIPLYFTYRVRIGIK